MGADSVPAGFRFGVASGTKPNEIVLFRSISSPQPCSPVGQTIDSKYEHHVTAEIFRFNESNPFKRILL